MYRRVVQLVIAEKPSVARDLARVLGVRATGQHAFEGERHVLTWCVGHLVELDEPAAYDPRWQAWRLDLLPMLPSEFRLRPAKHAAAQLKAVVGLLGERRFTSVVNACDAGREGELIFRYVVRFAGGGPPALRLWISSLTDEAIRRGFAALRPGAQLDPLGDAARSRSEADWLVGMNATRAITARGRVAGGSALYSIGRVQTPTLAMLVERDRAIAAFVPRPYWEVRGEFRTADGGRFTGMWRAIASGGRVATAAIAQAIVDRCTAASAVVERVRAKTVREPPPLLFDLTSLQRTANRRFGFSAARTLEIAQALYERHKVLTYPRTDSRHLTGDVARELPALFDALAAIPAYAPFASQLVAKPPRPSRRVVDDSKVHDHHAIIPTGKHASLDRDEERLFDLVTRRFLGAFFPDAEFGVTEAWIAVDARAADARLDALPPPELESRVASSDRDDGAVPILDRLPPPPDRFVARGRVRTVAGWQEVAGIDPGRGNGADRRDADSRGDDDKRETQLPRLVEGQPLAGAYESLAKRTTPPPPYSEATLLGAMESAGKSIDDEALRAAMKDCGLGTPATRASIIETLLRRGYIARDKQHLIATALGIGLIRALPVASLASAELTGGWEARLARIARGEDSRLVFMADIRRYVTEIVNAIRGAAPPDAPPAVSIGRCPRCGHDVVSRSRGYPCTSCDFAMPNRVAGRMIAPALAGVLLGRGVSQVLRGFRSKKGKKFSAALRLEPDGRIAFQFEDRNDRGPPDETAKPASRDIASLALTCPRCTIGTLIAGSRGWGCSRWRDGCRFVVWFESAGTKLTATQLRDLVTRGKTRKTKLGRLVLDVHADDGAVRAAPALDE